MVGAPLLAGEAALRVGAGLVTIASDKPVIERLERRVVEIMTLAVATKSAKSLTVINNYIKAKKISVLIIGPGMSPTSAPLVLSILTHTDLPIIIDGGALGILANNRKVLGKHATSELILTPHQGEFQRFFEQVLPTSQSAILKLAKDLAKTEKLILVLKGHPTHTINANGKITKNNSGGPELATAGTGDVLSGIIGGIIAQGIPGEEAVPAAVYLHGKAGDLAAEKLSQPGVIASDVIDYIPIALSQYE